MHCKIILAYISVSASDAVGDGQCSRLIHIWLGSTLILATYYQENQLHQSTVLKKQRHPCLLEVWTAPCNGWNQSIVDWCNHSCWWNQLIAGGLLDIRHLNGWKCCLKPGFLTRKPRISGQLCPSSNLKAKIVVSTYHPLLLEAVVNGDSVVCLSRSHIETLLGNAWRIH